MSGEGMAILWGAMKSCIGPGDRVLAISAGIYGRGFGDMARGLGAQVVTVEFGDDGYADDASRIRDAAMALRPTVVTAVHCETPSGTLQPIEILRNIVQEFNPVMIVDVVSSAFGVPVLIEQWGIDIALLGAQKCLSLPPDSCAAMVSDRAWQTIAQVNYVGYDAFQPFSLVPQTVQPFEFPYTPCFTSVAQWQARLRSLQQTGMSEVYSSHNRAAVRTRKLLHRMGIRLFAKDERACSPTVTAAYLPTGWTWAALDRELRAHGVVMAGSYGPMTGKVFRVGHMGTQASVDRVDKAMEVLRLVLVVACPSCTFAFMRGESACPACGTAIGENE
eukprot:TRINITY_DN2941_c0_g1_i1.p1 TRINITY_DN2941_c0_g1~~TRINITY_DN2941_c0_g1_i1.p1  ORF type:complete len:333 (-),score=47.14 TRINITY_DN2941_c0_g1_i1:182-1180(-)